MLCVNFSFKGLSIGTSAVSIFWSMISYAIATRRFNSSDTILRWSAIVLQTTWQVGMLIARFTAMVLFAFIFHFWFFLVMGKLKNDLCIKDINRFKTNTFCLFNF